MKFSILGLELGLRLKTIGQQGWNSILPTESSEGSFEKGRVVLTPNKEFFLNFDLVF